MFAFCRLTFTTYCLVQSLEISVAQEYDFYILVQISQEQTVHKVCNMLDSA